MELENLMENLQQSTETANETSNLVTSAHFKLRIRGTFDVTSQADSEAFYVLN